MLSSIKKWFKKEDKVETTNLFGWVRDSIDPRDQQFPATLMAGAAPKKYLMEVPFRYNQGSLGSCTAQSGVALYRFTAIEEHKRSVDYSKLFLYLMSRIDMDTQNQDSGASLRGMMKAMAKYGLPHEASWPYLISKFKVKPSKAVFDEALKNRPTGKMYGRVAHTPEALKATLAANNPIVFGFAVPPQFMTNQVSRTGKMQMPPADYKPNGGHAMMIIGYDDDTKEYIVLNSWGSNWGQDGRVRMPQAFIENPKYCSDFWTMWDTAA